MKDTFMLNYLEAHCPERGDTGWVYNGPGQEIHASTTQELVEKFREHSVPKDAVKLEPEVYQRIGKRYLYAGFIDHEGFHSAAGLTMEESKRRRALTILDRLTELEDGERIRTAIDQKKDFHLLFFFSDSRIPVFFGVENHPEVIPIRKRPAFIQDAFEQISLFDMALA